MNAGFLNEVAEEIFPMLNAYALYEDKQLKLDLEPGCRVMMDEKEIRQLIINLVRNGLDAMGPGGIVTVTTRLKGPKILFQVADQGTGIPEEILDKLGTPFVTTKKKGTGLGLAVCHAIVNRHDATIEVDSGKEGTTFSICFPTHMGP